jgi:hypothetical protein
LRTRVELAKPGDVPVVAGVAAHDNQAIFEGNGRNDDVVGTGLDGKLLLEELIAKPACSTDAALVEGNDGHITKEALKVLFSSPRIRTAVNPSVQLNERDGGE